MFFQSGFRTRPRVGFARRGCFLAVLFFVLGTAGCRDRALVPGIGIELDSKFEKWTHSTLEQDQFQLRTQRFRGLENEPGFTRIFGGGGSQGMPGILSFLDERISYLVTMGDLEPRVRQVRAPELNVFSLGSWDEAPGSSSETQAEGGSGLFTLAVNQGTIWWYQDEAYPRGARTALKINGRQVVVENSRTGLIQLELGYFSSDFAPIYGGFFPRLAILVHEARHSDCTGGLTEENLAAFRNRTPYPNPACGHLHQKCPEGHPLAGIVACDLHAWGAYGVEALFTSTVVRTAEWVVGELAQELRMMAAESLGRAVLGEEMFSGKLPPADLSSEGRIR